MAAPVSNGVLRTNLADMKIGDYIRWGYFGATSNVAGTFTNDPDKLASLTDGTITTTPSSVGGFYFIKWKSGLLVADRAVQSAISAQSLNKAGYYTGGAYRCLSVDEVSAISNDDFNGSGITAFSKLGKTRIPGQGGELPCILCQNIKNEPIASDMTGPSNSVFGYTATSADVAARMRYAVACFLPVMEYVDNPKSTNIYY